MPVKKINEENLISVSKKIKRLPINNNPWRGALTKKDLIKHMKDIPDDAIIVISGLDHTFNLLKPINIKYTTALFGQNQITEDYGDDLTPENRYGKRKQVIVIS